MSENTPQDPRETESVLTRWLNQAVQSMKELPEQPKDLKRFLQYSVLPILQKLVVAHANIDQLIAQSQFAIQYATSTSEAVTRTLQGQSLMQVAEQFYELEEVLLLGRDGAPALPLDHPAHPIVASIRAVFENLDIVPDDYEAEAPAPASDQNGTSSPPVNSEPVSQVPENQAPVAAAEPSPPST